MKKILLSFLLLISVLMPLSSVFAQLKLNEEISGNTRSMGGSAGYRDVTSAGLPEAIAAIIKAFLGTLGVILVIMVVAAGWNWFTAGGDSTKVKKAKDQMVNAIIGIIIIFSAYSITYFVFKSADTMNSVNGGGVNSSNQGN